MSRPWRLQAPIPSENDIEAGCMTILALHNYFVIRLHAGVYKTLDGKRHIHGVKKGTPDYACMHGLYRGFLLEVKRPGGELSDDQEGEIAMLELRYRLPIAVVDSPDGLSEFLKFHERSP